MIRAALLAVACALAFAAPAAAWEELPPLELPAGASCLREAGPGQLAVLGRIGPRSIASDLLTVGDAGVAVRGSLDLGWLAECPAAGGAPGVAPLLAGPVWQGRGRRWSHSLPAGVVGERPELLRDRRRAALSGVAVAVARGGAAGVAWLEEAPGGPDQPNRLYAAVRPRGAARFGRIQLVHRGVSDWRSQPAVAIDPAGRAHVGWIGTGAPEGPLDRQEGATPDDVVRVATAPPGRAFGVPQDLGRTWGQHVALAAASDGGALLVALERGGTGAWERRPGQRRFARIRIPDISADEPAVALAAGGGAVLAYRNSGGVDVLRRQPGRRFGGRQEVFPDDEGATGGALVSLITGGLVDGPVRPADALGPELAVRLARDGAIVVSWVDAADEQGTTEPSSAHAVHGTLAGGFPQAAARLGGACRSASATAPIELADGRLAVAWADNAAVRLQEDDETIEGGGLVHVARPDRPAPTTAPPAPPGLTAELAERAVRVGDPLHVRVRCADGPCDVRAVAHVQRIDDRFGDLFGIDIEEDPSPLASSTTLATGAAGELELDPLPGYSFASAGTTAPVRVALAACAPAGPVTQQLTLEQPVRVAPVPPLPRIRQLRARRLASGAVRVTWRSARPAGAGTGYMVLDDKPSGRGPVASAVVRGRGRSRFAVTLRPRDKPIQAVTVVLHTPLSATADYETARVRPAAAAPRRFTAPRAGARSATARAPQSTTAAATRSAAEKPSTKSAGSKPGPS